MAGPGDEIAAGAGGHGRLRVSRADREQAIGTLKAAFVQGMVDRDEFGQRLGRAFAGRTHADLAAVTVGLPAGLTTAQPPEPAQVQGAARVLRPGRVIMVATTLYAAAWPLALSIHRNIEGSPVTFAHKLVVLSTLVYLLVAVVAVMRMQIPGGRSVPADSGPGGQRLARAVRHSGACRRYAGARQLPSAGHGDGTPARQPGAVVPVGGGRAPRRR